MSVEINTIEITFVAMFHLPGSGERGAGAYVTKRHLSLVGIYILYLNMQSSIQATFTTGCHPFARYIVKVAVDGLVPRLLTNTKVKI